mmetsp:Transcript_31347/g.100004  ORF Transcript_31347/g.100004 Transcript_31347/m.100004 type:complete len:384 (-) Transcript_31347:539-1690(-)
MGLSDKVWGLDIDTLYLADRVPVGRAVDARAAGREGQEISTSAIIVMGFDEIVEALGEFDRIGLGNRPRDVQVESLLGLGQALAVTPPIMVHICVLGIPLAAANDSRQIRGRLGFPLIDVHIRPVIGRHIESVVASRRWDEEASGAGRVTDHVHGLRLGVERVPHSAVPEVLRVEDEDVAGCRLVVQVDGHAATAHEALSVTALARPRGCAVKTYGAAVGCARSGTASHARPARANLGEALAAEHARACRAGLAVSRSAHHDLVGPCRDHGSGHPVHVHLDGANVPPKAAAREGEERTACHRAHARRQLVDLGVQGEHVGHALGAHFVGQVLVLEEVMGDRCRPVVVGDGDRCVVVPGFRVADEALRAIPVVRQVDCPHAGYY